MMSAKEELQKLRQKYHIALRRQIKDNTHLKEPYTPNSFEDMDCKVRQLTHLHSQITNNHINDQNRIFILSEMEQVLSSDFLEKEKIQKMIPTILDYVIARIQLSDKSMDGIRIQELHHLFEILACLVYIMEEEEVMPYQEVVVRIAKIAMLQSFNFRSKGILLCMNLSSFQSWQIISKLYNEDFFEQISTLIQNNPLDDTQKQNLLTTLKNFVVDPKCEIELLLKHFNCIDQLVHQNSDVAIWKELVKVLTLMFKKEKKVCYQEQFDYLIVQLIEMSQVSEDLIPQTVRLISLFIDQNQVQKIPFYLDKQILNYLATWIVKENKMKDFQINILIISIQIQSYINRKPSEAFKKQLLQLVCYCCVRVCEVQNHSVQEYILRLIKYSNLVQVMNTPEFIDMFKNLKLELLSNKGQRLLQQIIEKLPIEQAKNREMIVCQVTKMLREMRKSNVESLREKAEQLLEYIEEREKKHIK